MRRDRHRGGLRQRGDLLQFEHAAAVLHVRHEDIDRARGHVRVEALEAVDGLAAGGRHARGAVDGGQVFERARRGHFLEPEQVERLQAAGQIQAALQIEVAVCVDQEVRLRANSAAHRGGALNAQPGELLQPGRVGAPGHAVEGRQLDGVEAGPHRAFGHLCKAGWRTVLGGAVDVGVVANARVEAAAEQVIRGDAGDLAADVPEALFQAAQGDGGHAAAARDLRLGRHARSLDVEDAAALEQLEEPADQGDLGVVGAAVRGIANAGDARAGAEAREEPIAAPIDVHAEDFQAGDGDAGRARVGRRRRQRGRDQGLQQLPPLRLAHLE